jgi:hypothetical protein
VKLHQTPSSSSQVVPCWRTDMTKLIVAFCSFAKALKIEQKPICVCVRERGKKRWKGEMDRKHASFCSNYPPIITLLSAFFLCVCVPSSAVRRTHARLDVEVKTDSPHFIWQLSFVASHHYSAERVGSRLVGHVNTKKGPTGSGNRYLSDKTTILYKSTRLCSDVFYVFVVYLTALKMYSHDRMICELRIVRM